MYRWCVLFGLFLIVILLVGSSESVYAQDESCPEIVELALASVSDSCSDISRNSVCYGYNQVDASFNIDVPDGFFTQVADIAPLIDLETLQTAGLNTELDIWGVAVMNVQANIPNTLPGQAVTIVLMGNAEIQNEVDADSAFIPEDAISITTIASASNIRTSPSANATVLASVPSGTAFEADGQSPDGEWLRIVFEGRPAWISKSLVDWDEDVNSLPVIESGQFTPMQAFTFSTGIGQPVCSQAPDSIMIQGPENIEVTINANGTDITIGSTIVLKTPAENTLQLLSVSGSAVIDGLSVPSGFTVSTALSPDGNVISGTLSGFRAISDSELAELEVLESVNPNILQYPIVLPTRAEILRLQNAISNRESAIQDCRNQDLTAQQCLDIIGADGNLANRLQRCLDFGLSLELCRSIIGGELNTQIIVRCLSEGYNTEEECRAAYQANSETALESFCQAGGAITQEQCVSYCQSQGFSTLEECQAAATSFVTSESASNLMNLCQAFGANTLSECQTLCQEKGYTTIEECVAAANQAIETQPVATSTLTLQEKITAFCQSIGASTAAQCAQICQANGYSTVNDCYNGMGG